MVAIISNPTSPYLHCRIPNLTKMPNGDLYASWEERISTIDDSHKKCKLVKSTNRGVTWVNVTFSFLNHSGTDYGDMPAMLMRRSNGDYWCFYQFVGPFSAGKSTWCTTCLRISTDDMATWSDEIVLDQGIGTSYLGPASIDHPQELPSGHIIYPVYKRGNISGSSIYVQSSLLRWHPDNGSYSDPTNWETIYVAPAYANREYNEWTVQLTPDKSKLIGMMRKDSDTSIYQTESSDNGTTWSTPVQVITVERAGPSDLLFLNPKTLVVTKIQRLTGTVDALFSDDYGKTFATETLRVFTQTVAMGGYTSMVEVSPGCVMMIYESMASGGYWTIYQEFFKVTPKIFTFLAGAVAQSKKLIAKFDGELRGGAVYAKRNDTWNKITETYKLME